MNAKNAREFLPMMQALADGKTVQYQVGNGLWHDVEWVDTCEGYSGDFRIKPSSEEKVFDTIADLQDAIVNLNCELDATIRLSESWRNGYREAVDDRDHWRFEAEKWRAIADDHRN